MVGHELTHGTIEASCNLVYKDEPGALNEAFADCYGAWFNQEIIGDDNAWVIGNCTNFLTRDLSDP